MRTSTYAFIATAGLAVTSSIASAQVPRPITGDGGLLFTAFDANQSYSYYLGVTFTSFDPTTPGQVFNLPQFEGYFPDLNAPGFGWNLLAADSSEIPGEGAERQGIIATGELAGGFNDGALATAVGAVDQYIQSVNQACPESPVCLATADQTHYANRGGAFPYGRMLFPGQLLFTVNFGEEPAFYFAEQNNTGFFPIEEEFFEFTWSLTADGTLTYGPGGEVVIPLPAAGWLFLTGLVGLAARRARRA